MNKFTEAQTLWFVELYKQHECLWNTNHDDYRNQEARNAAYFNIAAHMEDDDFSVFDVKNKIKNLRSTYNQEIKKIMKSKYSGKVYVPSIKWFDLMQSIMPIMQDHEAVDSLVSFIFILVLFLIIRYFRKTKSVFQLLTYFLIYNWMALKSRVLCIFYMYFLLRCTSMYAKR